jgi:methyl-accepting chemotaxis protein-2 (aspartate sensor receptor)
MDDDNRAIGTTIHLYDKAVSAEVERYMTLFASFLPTDFTLDEVSGTSPSTNLLPIRLAA